MSFICSFIVKEWKENMILILQLETLLSTTEKLLVKKLTSTFSTKSNQVVPVNTPRLLATLSQSIKIFNLLMPICHANSSIRLKVKIFQMNIFQPLKNHSMSVLRRVPKLVIQSSVLTTFWLMVKLTLSIPALWLSALLQSTLLERLLRKLVLKFSSLSWMSKSQSLLNSR